MPQGGICKGSASNPQKTNARSCSRLQIRTLRNARREEEEEKKKDEEDTGFRAHASDHVACFVLFGKAPRLSSAKRNIRG